MVGMPCARLIASPFQIKTPQMSAPIPVARAPSTAYSVINEVSSSNCCRVRLDLRFVLYRVERGLLTMAKYDTTNPQIHLKNTKMACVSMARVRYVSKTYCGCAASVPGPERAFSSSSLFAEYQCSRRYSNRKRHHRSEALRIEATSARSRANDECCSCTYRSSGSCSGK
jgi:hypothetical protein